MELSCQEDEDQDRRSRAAFVPNVSGKESPGYLPAVCFVVPETSRSRFGILNPDIQCFRSERFSHFRSLLFDSWSIRRLHSAWRSVFKARPRVGRRSAYARELAFVFQYGLLRRQRSSLRTKERCTASRSGRLEFLCRCRALLSQWISGRGRCQRHFEPGLSADLFGFDSAGDFARRALAGFREQGLPRLQFQLSYELAGDVLAKFADAYSRIAQHFARSSLYSISEVQESPALLIA